MNVALADPVPQPFFNITAANTSQLSTGIQGAIAGNARKRILLCGDSTMYAQGSNNSVIGLKTRSAPYMLTQALIANGIPAEIDNFQGGGNDTITNYRTYDPRATSAINWGFDAAWSCGGFSYSTSTVGAVSIFTPGVTFDTIEFCYFEPAIGVSATVDAGGATLATITNSGQATNTQMKTVISVGGTASVVNVTCVVGPFTYTGVHVYTAAANKLSITGAGMQGALATDWSRSTNVYDPKLGLTAFAPDHTFIELTINDSNALTLSATYKAQIQAIVTAAQLSGGVTLVVGDPTLTIGAGRANLDQQRRIWQCLYDLAAVNNISLLNLPAFMNSYEALVANRRQFDGSHLSDAGYQFKGGSGYTAAGYANFFNRCR